MEYNVTVNWTNKTLRKLSLYLGFLFLIGFWIFYLVNLPMKNAPADLTVIYYFYLIPRWLLKVFGVTIIIGGVAFILFDVRRNVQGLMRIKSDSIIIETLNRCDIIKFIDLKRISFITPPLAFKPYRIEFIYPDLKQKRIKCRNKQQFYDMMKDIQSAAPEDMDFFVTAFESS